MPNKLPQRVVIQDLSKLIGILGPKIIGIAIQDAKKIDANLFSETNIDASVFLGLVEQTGETIKLTQAGREYYKAGSESDKRAVLKERLRQIPIYDRTIEFFYHNENFEPTKVDIASYWHDNFSSELEGMEEDDLTNAAIFYIRVLDAADLGKYVQAGRGRETHARLDKVKIAEYITSAAATPETIEKLKHELAKASDGEQPEIETPSPPVQTPSTIFSLSGSNIRALAKLQLELTEKELDSPGAKKLIIDMLDRLERENTVLKAKVDTYQKVGTRAAILEAAVSSLSEQNLLKASVNSIGGIILGASLSLSALTHQIVAAVLGLLLIVISIVLREKRKEQEEEES